MTATLPEQLDGLLARKEALARRAAVDPDLAQRLSAVRAWQAERLAGTYEDLRRDPRHTAAVEFFLTDLYGPQASLTRDRELRRAWEPLKRGLPAQVLEVLARALELDALSGELDEAVARHLPPGPISGGGYAEAYRACGQAAARERQIALIRCIGEDLDRAVRLPGVGLALRAARLPTHWAGFGVLHDFLERGYHAFRNMQGAQQLLSRIEERETRMMRELFAGARDPLAAALATPASTPQAPCDEPR
ncbi:MAG TPA: hypothetical protein VME21_03895 [Steroidobacteraceae bacterium]|nr:hypothetical protein [Steroidobacteraceae bacterium]